MDRRACKRPLFELGTDTAMSARPERAPGRRDLVAACGDCFGLCCVALPFSASADFAFDKDAGTPCVNLLADHRCGIHTSLRSSGFPGCTTFDCFGAGQKVSQVTFEGRDWRGSPRTAERMFAVFPIMRQLHELLWYLTEALTLAPAHAIHGDLRRLLDETERLADAGPDALAEVDVPAHRARVGELLLRASELVRAGFRAKDRRGADLMGADLRGADLRGVSLRGALLIAADLRGSDLRYADLLGADLRNAGLGGADLSESVFLTQPQVNAAKGDAETKLPAVLARPPHWS